MKPIKDESLLCVLCDLPLKDEVNYQINQCRLILHLECYLEHIRSFTDMKRFPVECPNPTCQQEHLLDCAKDSLARSNGTQIEERFR
jgi:hypothetical protein